MCSKLSTLLKWRLIHKCNNAALWLEVVGHFRSFLSLQQLRSGFSSRSLGDFATHRFMLLQWVCSEQRQWKSCWVTRANVSEAADADSEVTSYVPACLRIPVGGTLGAGRQKSGLGKWGTFLFHYFFFVIIWKVMHLPKRPQLNAAVAGPVHVPTRLAEGRGKGRLVEGYHSCIFRIRRLSQRDQK